MKVALDECLPRKLLEHLAGHEVWTVPQAGLAGKKNGQLLSSLEEKRFDVFVTVDKGIQYQQNLRERTIAIIVLKVHSNRLAKLLPIAPLVLAALATISPREIVVI